MAIIVSKVNARKILNILTKSLTEIYLSIKSVSKRARFNIAINKNNKLNNNKNYNYCFNCYSKDTISKKIVSVAKKN